MKYLTIEHDGNGGIEKSGVRIEYFKNKQDIEEIYEDYTIAVVPLSWVKALLKREQKKQQKVKK